MGKDPAMLWYWGDWNSGTATMTRHLKGCYMDLLHAQFNNGPLTLDEIKTILGADFGSWPALQKKFVTDANGNFFNERLKIEKEKRVAFVASRHKNLKTPHMDTHMKPHMPRHMENENEDVNSIEFKIKKGVKIFGDETELSVNIASKYIGESPCRLHGARGIRAYLEANAITTSHDDGQLNSFLKSRQGSYFDDGLRHFINALNKFKSTPQQGLVDMSDL